MKVILMNIEYPIDADSSSIIKEFFNVSFFLLNWWLKKLFNS